MNMETKVSVKLIVDESFVSFLGSLARMDKDEVVCNLYDAASGPLTKILSSTFTRHWSTKKFRFPNTELDLSVKVKFKTTYVNNKKDGDILITYCIAKSKLITFSEQDISTLAIEKFLLNKHGGDNDATSK